VWRHYLRPWATSEKIWCLREGKIFNSNLMGVAQERDFYKIKKLTNDELEFVRKLIKSPYSKEDAELNEGWLKMFQMPFELEGAFKKNQPNNDKINDLINTQIHNFEEDFHSQIESEGIAHLDALLSRDTSFYDETKNRMSFLFFISLQYLRTKKIQKNVGNSVASICPINFENIWPVLRHVYATQIAKSIYMQKDKYRLILLINQTGAPLITCDQPIINTYAVESGITEEVDKLEFYYPLSKDLAILVTEEIKYSKSKSYFLNFEDVVNYNKAIKTCSNEQIFSSCRESLEYFCL